MNPVFIQIDLAYGNALEVYEIIATEEVKLIHDNGINELIGELTMLDVYNYSYNYIANTSTTSRRFKIYSPDVLITQLSCKLLFLKENLIVNRSLLYDIETYTQE